MADRTTVSGHHIDCGWQLDQWEWDCTCGTIPKSSTQPKCDLDHSTKEDKKLQ